MVFLYNFHAGFNFFNKGSVQKAKIFDVSNKMATVYWFESDKKKGKTLPIEFVKMPDKKNNEFNIRRYSFSLKIKLVFYYFIIIFYFCLFINGMVKNYNDLEQDYFSCLDKQAYQKNSLFGSFSEYECVDKTFFFILRKNNTYILIF